MDLTWVNLAMLCLSSARKRNWSAAAAVVTRLLLHPLVWRGFRSPAALELLEAYVGANEGWKKMSRLVLYNYPSCGGAFSALFAHLYHSTLNLPCIVLPNSSVEPFRVEDFRFGGIHTAYLLDFIGPKGFAAGLAKVIPRVVTIDHRLSTLSKISNMGKCPSNLDLRIDTGKCSAQASLDYFSERANKEKPSKMNHEALMNLDDLVRVKKMIKYIEDIDLHRWELAGIEEFEIGIRDFRANLNTLTNPCLFKQLLKLDADDLIVKGSSQVASRLNSAKALLAKPFKIRLGRGLYGECLGIRVDGNAELSHEIAVELSRRSTGACLRPIGAAIFMQRGNLKICLRTTDRATDTSEIAKAYGGGGKQSSSSFIIRMDEYNEWTAVNSL